MSRIAKAIDPNGAGEQAELDTAQAGTDAIASREDEAIASVLREFIGCRSNKRIATDTCTHPESVRRYLSGKSRIPAVFIGAICLAYHIDPAAVLLTSTDVVFRKKPTMTPEERIAESLSSAIEQKAKQWIHELLNSPNTV